jgi:hypothetical protein
MLIIAPFLILIAHLATSAWEKGRNYFYSTQISLIVTFICWSIAFEEGNTIGLLIVFSLISLMINMRYITMTSFLDLKYQGLSKFKDFCLQKGHLTIFESFTINGLYLVVGSIWVIAVIKITEKLL